MNVQHQGDCLFGRGARFWDVRVKASLRSVWEFYAGFRDGLLKVRRHGNSAIVEIKVGGAKAHAWFSLGGYSAKIVCANEEGQGSEIFLYVC